MPLLSQAPTFACGPATIRRPKSGTSSPTPRDITRSPRWDRGLYSTSPTAGSPLARMCGSALRSATACRSGASSITATAPSLLSRRATCSRSTSPTESAPRARTCARGRRMAPSPSHSSSARASARTLTAPTNLRFQMTRAPTSMCSTHRPNRVPTCRFTRTTAAMHRSGM